MHCRCTCTSKWTHEECEFDGLFFSSSGCLCEIFFTPVCSCVCVCVWHFREVKFDSNGVSGTIICFIRPRYLNVWACQTYQNELHLFVQTAVNPWSSCSLLCLICPLSACYPSTPPTLPSLISPLQQTLQFQSSDSGNERNGSFTPRYLSSSSSYHTRAIPPCPSSSLLLLFFFLHLFLLTLPSSSYSIFLLILCHLTPPTSPVSTFHLPPSLGHLFSSVPVLSQSLSPWLLAASPAPSLSLCLCLAPSLSQFASTLPAQDWERICHFFGRKLTALCVCECYYWSWICSVALTLSLHFPSESFIKGMWRSSCCHIYNISLRGHFHALTVSLSTCCVCHLLTACACVCLSAEFIHKVSLFCERGT